MVEIRTPQVTLPLLMSSFNHEKKNHLNLSDVWPQWTRVKRRIGAPNSSRKQIKNKEVETLPAGSGGTESVPTVSWTGAKNGEPWKLGWVCAVIDENKRWSANDHSNRNCLVSCEYHTTESRRGSLSLHQVKIVIFYLLLTGHIIWGKNQLQHCSF